MGSVRETSLHLKEGDIISSNINNMSINGYLYDKDNFRNSANSSHFNS